MNAHVSCKHRQTTVPNRKQSDFKDGKQPMPVTSETNLTQYYYGNSLVNFAGGNAFSNVPYWMNQFITHASGEYAVNGGYGFLQQFADRTEPANEWGFSGTDGLWDTDVAEFDEVTFD